MQTTRRFGKSMFQRRVLILAACALLVNLLLAAQLYRLAVDQGQEHLQVAQSRLQVQTWLPTWRGSIIDRNGTVLAEDRPAYDVLISYDMITGSWIDREAARDARASAGSEMWRAMGPGERDALIREYREPHDDRVGKIWGVLSNVSGQSTSDLEATRNRILQRVQHMAAVVWQRQRQQHENRFGTSADAPEFRERPIAEQEAFHVILPNVNDAQAMRIQQLAADHPDLVKVEYARTRWRPASSRRVFIEGRSLPRGLQVDDRLPIEVGDVGLQIIGEVRRGIWEEDMKRRPFRDPRTGVVDRGGYMIDDEIGSYGIERAMEDELRGARGSIQRRRDRSNETRVEPVPGGDVQLTIDIELQARLEALLAGDLGLTRVQPWHGESELSPDSLLNAAAVVLEIDTGEILAMASFPSRSDEDELSPVERDARSPWLDRVSEAVYPPGSIVKPLVLAAAVTEGVHGVEDPITCNGHHFPAQPNIARCWIYRQANGMATHGPLQSEEALARSCNCFFYELGARLGLARVSDWMGYFGGGRQLGIGISPGSEPGGEASGSLPDAESIAELDRRGEGDFEAIMLGIGQGRFTWTPLHAANAFAILARHGRRLPPSLIRGAGASPPGPDRTLDPRAVDAAMSGLEASVTKNHGTGSRLRYGPGDYDSLFDVDPVRIWGKTGTAQAPPMRIDLDGDGVLGEGDRIDGLHHAWFVGYAGEQDPEYAFAVVVEHGGSGGRVAGPIANQVIHALMETGYLPEATREAFH